MSVFADWWIGSAPLTAQAINVNGGNEVVNVPRGSVYLWSTLADVSLFAQLELTLAAGGVINPRVFLTTGRYVRIEADAPFTLLWDAGIEIRNLLGFTSDLAGFDGYTAAELSPLMWSPGLRMTPDLAPLDFDGQPVADMAVQVGAQGKQTARQNGEPSIINRFRAEHVQQARYRKVVPGPVAGELYDFWERVLSLSRLFIIIREVLEGTSSTDAAVYESNRVLGPYVFDLTQQNSRRFGMARATGFARVECYYRVVLAVIQTQEYEA